MAFTIPFGLVFELPVVVFLSKLGIVSHEMLARNRKYALLGIVILAAALTRDQILYLRCLWLSPLICYMRSVSG